MNLKELYNRLFSKKDYDLSRQEQIDIDSIKDEVYVQINYDRIKLL
ncbi:MAG: hypothetical protein PWR10_1588 [Halanaerobiales bacterium]|nr:hypothetical protein [Halanaerobiales bacterium]